jgi:HSP20 family protein
MLTGRVPTAIPLSAFMEDAMANIAVRPGEVAPILPFTAELEPYRRMVRDFFNWDPFQTMLPIRVEEPIAGFVPNFEVKETKEAYVIKADLPGVKEADLEITLTGNRLGVTGKRETEKEEKSETYYACEREYGGFTRAFTLPEGADAEHARAELKEGVLTIVLPKRPELQPKRITVKTPEKAKA